MVPSGPGARSNSTDASASAPSALRDEAETETKTNAAGAGDSVDVRVHNFVYPLWVVDQVLRDAIIAANIEGVAFIRAARWPAAEDDDGDAID